MFRVITVVTTSYLLIGCLDNEPEGSVTTPKDLSRISFNKTIRFPVETVIPVKLTADSSCTMGQKLVPLDTHDGFLSFRYQKCASKSVTTVVNEDNIQIIWAWEMPIGSPLQHRYPPLMIENNNKPPEDYLNDLYTTDGERKYCKRLEKLPNIWEIKNIGFTPIPSPPSNTEIFAEWTPPSELSKTEREALAGAKINKAHKEHHERFRDQESINRICDNLPIASYIFFEDEYVLIMPRYFVLVLDVTSIKYHKK